MYNRYHALQEKRATLTAEQTAIFAAADKEARALTDDEKARDDAINAELVTVAADLAREERRRENERTMTPLTLPDAVSVTGVPDNPRPFKSLGEQMQAVVRATVAPAYADPRIEKYNAFRTGQIQAATGMHEGGLAEGGAFVQTEYSNTLMERTYQVGEFLRRVPEQPIGEGKNSYSVLLIKETSRAAGSRYGGIRIYRVGEGGTISGSKPEFERREIRPFKLAGMCALSDELVQDVTALTGHVNRLFPLEAAYVMENELVNGTGVGMSMGVLNAGATVSVAIEAGQAAASLLAKNISKMWARLWAPSRANSVWFYNQDCEPALDGLFIPVGVGGLTPSHIITYAQDGSMRIKGRPAIPIEPCPTLGTVGDLMLIDPSQYLAVTRGGMRTDSSMLVYFDTDETALRFVWRWTAEPLWRSPLTPASGSANTLSPLVTLATR